METKGNYKGSNHNAATSTDTGWRPVNQVEKGNVPTIIEILPWHGWEVRQAR